MSERWQRHGTASAHINDERRPMRLKQADEFSERARGMADCHYQQ